MDKSPTYFLKWAANITSEFRAEESYIDIVVPSWDKLQIRAENFHADSAVPEGGGGGREGGDVHVKRSEILVGKFELNP